MAVKEIKDMGASVLTRLKKQAKETGINYQTCLQLFAQEEFLRKLEMSESCFERWNVLIHYFKL